MGAGCAAADRVRSVQVGWNNTRSRAQPVLSKITLDEARGAAPRRAAGPGPPELPIRHSSDSPQFPRLRCAPADPRKSTGLADIGRSRLAAASLFDLSLATRNRANVGDSISEQREETYR